MSYHYHIPNDLACQTIVKAVWQVDHLPAFNNECIVPKGIIEIIFNFNVGDTIAVEQNGKDYELPDCFINGFNTQPITLQLPPQQFFFGVIFQPLAIKKLFGYAAAEFCDTSIDATLVHAALGSLWHQLAEQPDFDARVAVLLKWASQHCIEWQPQEKLVNDFLYAAGGHHLSVQQLAGSLCYSARQLSRKMQEASGMNTEEMLLYKKYLHAVELMHTTHLPLTSIAYQCQFADQSHFIKTFKYFTRMTPGAYQRSKSMVRGHLYMNVR